MPSILKKVSLLILGLGCPSILSAQTEQSQEEFFLTYMVGIVFLLAVVILIYVIFALIALKDALLQEKIKQAETAGQPAPAHASVWDNIWSKITGLQPMEEESKLAMHHEYDGIQELDNYLPPWWTYGFILTIVIAIIYVFVYHVWEVAPLQAEEYEREIAIAAEQAEARKLLAGASLDESSVEFSDNQTHLDNGEAIFIQRCAACHRNDGGGGVGPNMTDDYWIHGGSIQEVFTVIKYGVPEKGMISWQAQLSPTDMRDVSSYILTLAGTDPPDAKAPQGELYKP